MAKRERLLNLRAEKLADSSFVERALPDAGERDGQYVSMLAPVWVPQSVPVSGVWYNFPTFGSGGAGVNGIYGCTSVIIISEKGTYISHIWEIPVFIVPGTDYVPSDDQYFADNSYRALINGSPTTRSIRELVGTDDRPGPLHEIYNPEIYVLTPDSTLWDMVTYSILDQFRYQARAVLIANKIHSAIPGSSVRVMGYTRTDPTKSTEVGFAGRTIVEADQNQYWAINHMGGVPCLIMGRYRLWVEDLQVRQKDF
ncbi:hypothetical protein BGZ63DRAFT_359699, partial [Mariannaea sp. PMI_226]